MLSSRRTRRFCRNGYARPILWRARNPQVRSKLAPLGFIQPSRPTLSKKPPTGELWVHEVKHDGYRLQVHIRVGRVLEYAAAKRGLFLTVHALNKVKEVLKWELVGDRKKALEAIRGEPGENDEKTGP